MKREWRRGLSTQPCGTPVFRMRVEEVWFSDLSDWGLLVRKSSIQLQREVLITRSLSLVISLEGMMVLKVYEQHSHVGVVIVQVGKGGVYCRADGILPPYSCSGGR